MVIVCILQISAELVKRTWMQVLWVPERKGLGIFAVENGQVCSESEAAFMSNGYAEMGIYTFEEYRNRGFAYAAYTSLFT